MFELDTPLSSAPNNTSAQPLHARGKHEQVTTPLLLALLDRLPAVALLDSAGGLTFWNAAARARLGASGWTLCTERRLHAPAAAERDALSRALTNACTHGRVQLLAMTLQGRRAHVAVTPIEAQGGRWAALLLDRDAVCGAIELQLFASSIGLTLAESRVLSGLVHGKRPAQIARQHGVLPSTVRSQAAALRQKAQCASIGQLLERVARLPGLQAASVFER